MDNIAFYNSLDHGTENKRTIARFVRIEGEGKAVAPPHLALARACARPRRFGSARELR